MGRKCGVQGCLSDSNRVEDIGVTFHKVPMHPEIRSKWLTLCRIPEEKKLVKVVYVCSRHFLRADFCNFKGKKYMLRQGVFPSVFPWDKSKLEAIKSEKHQSKSQSASASSDVKTELKEVEPLVKSDLLNECQRENKGDITSIKKEEPTSETENDVKIGSSGSIDFSIDNRINALDFNNIWYPAKIVEVDEEENEVLIHFENNGNEYDEWICMDSPRLRPLGYQDEAESVSTTNFSDDIVVESVKVGGSRRKEPVKYDIGERCLAYWSGRRKFPATVTKSLENDMYEVLFDDGYVKTVKRNRLVKSEPYLQSSPLFEPIQSSKQERRDKKRKLNVAELFGIGKRQKSSSSPCSPKVRKPNTPTTETPPVKILPSEPVPEYWVEWLNDQPVGVESQLDTQDGKKKTIIIQDPRLPEGWAKHLLRRGQGTMIGKWDAIITSPDGKRFRSRHDIKHYLEATKSEYDENIFDFKIYKQRQRRKGYAAAEVEPQNTSVETQEQEEEEEEEANLLKIPIIDDAYKCPIEGCGKNFRKENLAQMHVKHYHPEYSKFLDTTPNVADLAYARTVGDSLDKSPVPIKSSRSKNMTPDLQDTGSPKIKKKDSEIIKLLNTKPFDTNSDVEPLPSGLPPDMYPDIKLKDLLSKSEAIPKRDDINLRTLSTTRPPVGIKTLLPVRKSENIEEPSESTPKPKQKYATKRKRGGAEQAEPIKPKEPREEVPLPAPPPQVEPAVQPDNNVIIEGGQLIKIVRMKQEEIINCTCGFTEEDGLMIQCELCLCWQHAYCNNIQKESEVPDKYICYICQHPLRQRSSRKYYHDQDWLKQGMLPVGSFHTKDDDLLQKRFDRLRKSHDVSGGLVEVQEFVNTLKVKLKIAEARNHPKLYLWSKPWEKLPLPEKLEEKVKDETTEKLENEDEHQLSKDLKSLIENTQTQVPIIPQPEAAIDTADCRLNLLDHILHSQELVMERLQNFEKHLDCLEENSTPLEKDEDYPRTRQTLEMLMRDLSKLEELSQNTCI